MELPLQTKVFIENQIALIKDKESLNNIQLSCWKHVLNEFNSTSTLESMICLSMQLYTKILLESNKNKKNGN